MNRHYAVGGVTLSVQSVEDYFNLELLDSVQGWRKKWFYIRDCKSVGQLYDLAPFDPATPAKRTHACMHNLKDHEAAEVEGLCQRIAAMKPAPTLTQKTPRGLFIIANFMKRYVQPLQHRVHPMWQDTGMANEERLYHEDLSSFKLAPA